MTVQPGGQFSEPQSRAPGRGQLDGQGDAVQPGAHLRDRGRVVRRQLEGGAGRTHPGGRCARRAARAPPEPPWPGTTPRMPRLVASYDLAGRDIPPSADAAGSGNRESFLTGNTANPGGTR